MTDNATTNCRDNVLSCISELLEIKATDIDLNSDIFELGFDSLSSLLLINLLEDRMQIKIQISEIYNIKSINDLIECTKRINEQSVNG